ncbi:hypothetical protein KR074_003558 [Drosophila pseudoananassae]|nr:hypothetical protein KR074_003558 [Drosophila pseudoananassae]
MSYSDSESDANSRRVNEDIVVKVLDQRNSITKYRVFLNTPLVRVMKAYCDKANKSIETSRFLYNGVVVSFKDTPLKRNMESGDTIEVYSRQEGGFYAPD